MAVNNGGAQALGIDVGGTTIKVCRVDDAGRRNDERTRPTPRAVPELVAAVVAEVATSRETATLGGIGVVVPGIVDEHRGVAVASANLGWHDVPMARLLTEAIGTPVALGHDVRAGALAESRWGAGVPTDGPRHGRDMLYVAIGTGISAGLVLGGSLVSVDGYTGEIGQLLVHDPHDGERRPMEQIASAAALARRETRRRERVGLAPGTDAARGVVERAGTGDDIARAVLDEAVEALGAVLAATTTLLGPLPVVIGGGLSGAGRLLLDPLARSIARHFTVVPPPPLELARLGSWSQAMGAAALGADLAAPGVTAPGLQAGRGST